MWRLIIDPACIFVVSLFGPVMLLIGACAWHFLVGHACITFLLLIQGSVFPGGMFPLFKATKIDKIDIHV